MAKEDEFGQPSTFCIFPWTELCFDIHGYQELCSRSNLVRDEQGEFLSLPLMSEPDEIWNSGPIRKVRRQMLSGELPSICKLCIDSEKEGITSKRQEFLRIYPLWADSIPALLAATEADGSVNLVPRSYDLRTSNLCNANCVTCSPEYSSRWFKPLRLLQQSDPLASQSSRPAYLGVQKPGANWAVESGLYDRIKREIGEVRRLSFSGGEPLMIAANTDLVDYCIESGRAKYIHLIYDTNALLIDQKWLERWNEFAGVEIRISLDGLGEKFNYIRYPGPFKRFEEKVRMLAEWNNPRIRITGQVTISLLNVLDLSEIFSWYWRTFGAETRVQKKMHFKLVLDPKSLNLVHAPESVWAESFSRLTEFEQQKLSRQPHSQVVTHLKLLKDLLNKHFERRQPDSRLLAGAMALLNGLDAIHGTSWPMVFPELAELLDREISPVTKTPLAQDPLI